MTTSPILCLLAALLGLGVRADGLRIRNGVYTGGPFVVLALTAGQQHRIRSHPKGEVRLVLTAGQQYKIAAETRLPGIPTRIYVADPEYWEGMCTCFSSNIGILFRKGYVQLPIDELRSDREAEARLPDPSK